MLALAASLAAVASCAGSRTVTIKELLDDPSQYNGKSVQVQGDVKENLGVLGYGAYRLDDGTGSITVVSKESGAPREGANVKVQGKFRSAFTLGTRNAAVIMESRRVK
jgi:hypothetical protein